jgi:hypothetical protein
MELALVAEMRPPNHELLKTLNKYGCSVPIDIPEDMIFLADKNKHIYIPKTARME